MDNKLFIFPKYLLLTTLILFSLIPFEGCSGCDQDQSEGSDTITETLDQDLQVDGEQSDGHEGQWDVHNDDTEDSVEDEDQSLPYVEECGNGILDEGEECDDRNRLNGDGCDWLCRNGDGDPPPEPDPSVDPYVPSGDPVFIEETSSRSWLHHRLPLIWTGSEFSTAFYHRDEDDSMHIRFMRFDEEGRPTGSDWFYPAPSRSTGLDLVWTGTGFGLFFVDLEVGIYYLRLSQEGKPLGSPVLVEADPLARMPAADNFDDGFVLAWLRMGSLVDAYCAPDVPPAALRVGFLHVDGTTTGFPGPVTVEDQATGPPDVVTGEDGFGLTVQVIDLLNGICCFKFLLVNTDLSTITHSGVLSDGYPGDVVWTDNHYIIAWDHLRIATDENETCMARFSPDGILERPPVCNNVTSVIVNDPGPTRLGAGDDGLLIATAFEGLRLLALRTDLIGAAVLPHMEVTNNDDGVGAFGVAWGMDSFFVLLVEASQLRLYEFVAE